MFYFDTRSVSARSSADGLKDELLSEIERVIFEAHSTLERDGATDFGELLELRTTVLRDNRDRDEEAIETLSDQIGLEREKQSQIAGLKSQITQKDTLIAGYIKSRDKLVTAGSEERVARLNTLTEAADYVRTQIGSGRRRARLCALCRTTCRISEQIARRWPCERSSRTSSALISTTRGIPADVRRQRRRDVDRAAGQG